MRPKNEGAIKPAGERQVKISRWISGKSAESLPGLRLLLRSFAMASFQLGRNATSIAGRHWRTFYAGL
jgi:hypothetical protein